MNRLRLLWAGRILWWLVLLAIAVGLLLALSALLFGRATGTSAAELINPGFEGGWTRATTYWTPAGGPYHTEFSEIFAPTGWTVWWREGFPCSVAYTFETGRPEVVFATLDVDPSRVHSGQRAMKFFTFYRCHDGGFYLGDIPVTPGKVYIVSVYAHSWYSSCSSRPHERPYESDCVTPLNWAHDWLMVGIDPFSGKDPLAPSVAWSQPQEVYGTYGGVIFSPRITAQKNTISVFLRAVATHPLKHGDVYWDDVSLLNVTHTIFLPLVVRRYYNAK